MPSGGPIDASMRVHSLVLAVKFKLAQDAQTCGYLLVYCWKCGTELREDAAFCSKCGASVRGTMGVQSPTGFELLRDDKNVQNHWARRLIAYVIDVALVTVVTVVLTIIAVAESLRFFIGLGSPTVGTFPAVWAALWGLWFGGP